MFIQFSIFPLGMKLVHAFFFWSFSNKAFLFVACWLMLYISNYKHYDTLFQSSCRQQQKKKRLRFKQFCNPCKSSLFWNTFMWINSNDHFKLNRTKKEQYNSRRIDGNRKNFPCALENSATNSVSWFLMEKKKRKWEKFIVYWGESNLTENMSGLKTCIVCLVLWMSNETF